MGRSFLGDFWHTIIGAAIIGSMLVIATIITPVAVIGVPAYVGFRLWRDSPARAERLAREETLALYEHAPGGEGFARLRARCTAFLDSLTAPTLCVTHGITSRMLRTVALGRSSATLGDLPGGQGVVYVVENGADRQL